MDVWFFLFVALVGYEIYQFNRMRKLDTGDKESEDFMPRVPFADFDYTNEKQIEEGHFDKVERHGASYIYTLPSGVLYKSYFPYSKTVEKNYDLPDTNVKFA